MEEIPESGKLLLVLRITMMNQAESKQFAPTWKMPDEATRGFEWVYIVVTRVDALHTVDRLLVGKHTDRHRWKPLVRQTEQKWNRKDLKIQAQINNSNNKPWHNTSSYHKLITWKCKGGFHSLFTKQLFTFLLSLLYSIQYMLCYFVPKRQFATPRHLLVSVAICSHTAQFTVVTVTDYWKPLLMPKPFFNKKKKVLSLTKWLKK